MMNNRYEVGTNLAYRADNIIHRCKVLANNVVIATQGYGKDQLICLPDWYVLVGAKNDYINYIKNIENTESSPKTSPGGRRNSILRRENSNSSAVSFSDIVEESYDKTNNDIEASRPTGINVRIPSPNSSTNNTTGCCVVV